MARPLKVAQSAWPILSRFEAVGALSVRFLKGRVRCCLHHGSFAEAKSGPTGRIAPTLRKKREEWGSHFVFCAGE